MLRHGARDSRVFGMFLAGALCWPASAGCGGRPSSPPPKTYPVTGQLVYKGGEPLQGGMVEFHSKSDHALTTMSEIKQDGKFELFTLFEKGRLPGAPEGAYQVTIGFATPQVPAVLPGPYTVEPKDNFFRLEIDKPRPRETREGGAKKGA